jgi:uncharacterized protein DUF4908
MVRRELAGLLAVFWVVGSIPASALEVTSELELIEEAVPTKEDPRVGYYASETEKTGFVLDRTRDHARLRFDRSKEILILDMVPGPQGVTYFKDEFGTTVLRLMPYGGATVYEADGSDGGAFGRKRKAKPLELRPRGIKQVKARSNEIEIKLKDRFAFKVSFAFDPSLDELKVEAQVTSEARTQASADRAEGSMIVADMAFSEVASAPQSSMSSRPAKGMVKRSDLTHLESHSLFDERSGGKLMSISTAADALEVVNAALKRLATDDLALEVMREEILQIRFVIGHNKALSLEEGVLIIAYAPDMGLEGRPSSAEIERFLLENL